MHFEENMWEKTREDGSHRLKCNAFPTLFSFTKIIKQRKPPLERSNVPLAKINNLCTNEILTDSKTLLNNNSHIEREEEGQFNCNQNNMEKYNKICSKLWVNANKYKIMYYNTTKKLKAAEMIIQNQKNRLSLIFNNDQMKALSKKSTMFMKWSNETVKKALKLKFACGNNGYNEILSQNIPLPSLRTLRRRLQNLKFDSGILDEVYDFLKRKVESFKCEYERECVLIMDEMAITPTSFYDTSLNKYIGNVTLPEHKGVATNVMVFMLGGITSRWKQTVGYYFTGKSVNGIVYDRIIKDIIAKSEEIGLKIVSIISDMGSSNQALWRNWNIQAKQHSEVRNSIPHPYDSTRKIYIVPDPVHLFKNMKNMLMTNKVLTDDIKKKYNLPTRDICAQHILDVVNYQKNLKFQLAPKLTEQDLFPNHFQTMKVSISTNVISHDVYSAFLAEELHKPEYLTTAWYIEIIDKWFNLMTSRSPVMSLSKLKPLVYKEAISFLNQFIDIMRKPKVGGK